MLTEQFLVRRLRGQDAHAAICVACYIDPIVQVQSGDGHVRRARGYRQMLLEINRVITTVFAAPGLDGCV